jgi:hypothetical protein
MSSIITLENNQPLLSALKIGKGNLFVSAVAFDKEQTNLINHPLFIPLLYRIALIFNQDKALAYTIGTDNVLPINDQFEGGKLILKNGENTIKPYIKKNTSKDITTKSIFVDGLDITAANYQAIIEGGNNVLDVYAFNYDRQESIMQYLTMDEITSANKYIDFKVLDGAKKEITSTLKKEDKGNILWKWFIWSSWSY